MSHVSKLFQDHKVQIKNKSGFDLAHSNFLTQKCGQLTPVCTIPMLPNDSISLGFMSQIKLPPMATSFYGRVDYRLEAFFVPYRILWGGWENFYTQPIADPYGTAVERPHFLPNYQDRFVGKRAVNFKRGSLADYLGIKGAEATSVAEKTYYDRVNNIFPFLAYHKIYDDWYRNVNIQKPAFVRKTAFANGDSCGCLPFYPSTVTVSDTFAQSGSVGSAMSGIVDEDSLGDGSKNTPLSALSFNRDQFGRLIVSTKLADGFSLFDLRQRNWSKDYFTTATLYPQQNGATAGAGIRSALDTSDQEHPDGSTTFSISQIRQANILQKWLERNNIAGSRYADQIRATFGVLPSDAMLDRPIFLGGSSFGIYTNSIAQTVNSDKGASSNPYSGMAGADSGQTSGFGKDSLIDKFTATEHGIIMVIGSIVPHATYSTGTSRMFAMSQFGDIPNPMFEGLGQESILTAELSLLGNDAAVDNKVFGYVDQYAWMKYMNDEVHGLLVDGESLESFSLQRSFNSDSAKLDSSFIQIPLDYLDQVLAVKQEQSGFSSWANFYFDVKKTSLLSQYIIPTLGEPKNTHTETVPNTGRSL
jgi:hypothetical protein